MTFEIEIAGRTRTVAVERTEGGHYRVSLDGTPHVVDAVRVGSFGLSLVLDGAAGASREVHVAPLGRNADEAIAWLDGRAVPVTVNGRRRRRRGGGDAGAHAGEQVVSAPMPGRVVRVLVGPGDEVQARQPVVVVEAMKMENELRAPRAGTVREVTVSAGMSVELGRALVTIA